jgi:hypothetical protein
MISHTAALCSLTRTPSFISTRRHLTLMICRNASPPAERGMRRIGQLISSLAPQPSAATATPPRSIMPAAAAAASVGVPSQVNEDSGYRMPPPEIAEIVDYPPEPLLSFSPDRSLVLQLSRPPPLPPISELARPELKLAGAHLRVCGIDGGGGLGRRQRGFMLYVLSSIDHADHLPVSATPCLLAGLRIDPESYSRSRMSYYTAIAFAPFTDDLMLPIKEKARAITGIPRGYLINYVTWSPDSKRIAFTLRSSGGDQDPPRAPLQLWVADIAGGGAAHSVLNQPLNVIFEE